MSDPRRNAEGYLVVTAYLGTKNVIQEENEAERKNKDLIHTFRLLPGWERSIGASRELGFALGTDKIIVSLEQLLTKKVTLL